MGHTDQTTPRDRNLDIYRGCIMIYIVGIIHILTIYISWYESNAATLLLIEMPVVFYISGAAYSLSKKKNYPQYIWSRIKRIVMPYYIFVIIITVTNYYKQCIHGSVPTGEFIQTFIENKYYNIFSGNEHLWFIPVYLKIALILPLLHYISRKITSNSFYILLGITALILYIRPNNEVCYTAFAFAGMYYHKNKPYNKHILLSATLLLTFICYANGYPLNMQINKFPANLFFFSYTICALLLLKKPLQWLCHLLASTPMRHLIAIYARHDYSIYLYHMAVISSFVHLIQFAAYRYFPYLYKPAVNLPVAIIYILLVTAATSILCDKINNLIISKLSLLWHKIRPIFMK